MSLFCGIDKESYKYKKSLAVTNFLDIFLIFSFFANELLKKYCNL